MCSSSSLVTAMERKAVTKIPHKGTTQLPYKLFLDSLLSSNRNILKVQPLIYHLVNLLKLAQANSLFTEWIEEC